MNLLRKSLRAGRRLILSAAAIMLMFAAGSMPAAEQRQFTFAWPFVEGDAMQPRGGTTRGPDVQLLEEATPAFRRLQEPGLGKLERDRRAILAMAGDYRVSFDFLEVMGFEPDFSASAPYQSWGTERIYVLRDESRFISLQHVLAMTPVGEDGNVLEPVVIKHWRQDWHYEAPSVHVYRGHNTWSRTAVDAAGQGGYWVQTVWQVDDSPRYAGWGSWQHHKDYSTWESNTTWRPLPRREFSVRDDYDVLIGTNRHNIVATGWVQEETNLKVVLTDSGEPDRVLAKEYGLARYEAIRDHDFSAADEYLQATAEFWSQARSYWNKRLQHDERIHLRAPVDQGGLFRPLFERARAIVEGREYTRHENQVFIEKVLSGYFSE